MALTAKGPGLLMAGMRHLLANRDEWRQWTWGFRTECGTFACLAGRITLIDDPTQLPPVAVATVGGQGAPLIASEWLVNGQMVYSHAEELLGLTQYQADLLFDGGNSIGALQAGVRAVIITDGEVDEDTLGELMVDEDLQWLPEGAALQTETLFGEPVVTPRQRIRHAELAAELAEMVIAAEGEVPAAPCGVAPEPELVAD